MIRTLLTTALTFLLAGPAWAAGPAAPSDNTAGLLMVSATISTVLPPASPVIPMTLSETTAALSNAGITPAAPQSASPCALGIGPCGHTNGYARPALLPALYVGSAILNGFDVYSTMKGLSQGAHEANPLMQSAVTHPVAFIALKAAAAALPIMAAEQLWKSHHPVAAIAAMVATNGFMSWVAVHNASVLRQLGR
jgi:Domain of unknown function (DUF5658)